MAKAKEKKGVFSEEEQAAMKDYVREKTGKPAENEGAPVVLARIAKMAEPDRTMARRVHSIIMASAPSLVPRLWYGMPAYSKDGKVLCFFQDAAKFKSRYATLGFSDRAKLDEGSMWPTSFALKGLGAAEEARIKQLVKKAVG